MHYSFVCARKPTFFLLWTEARAGKYHLHQSRFLVWMPLKRPCVCQRVKLYQTSHHYKLIPQPQEGLHNGQCFVGVTQASPLTPGSGLSE